MQALKRHQHIFTTLAGDLVTSTIIPFGASKHEAITVISLSMLIGLSLYDIEVMTTEFRVEILTRNGQNWVAVEDAMRMFDLRTVV